MRVLLVHNANYLGGAEQSLLELACGLEAGDVQPHLALWDAGGAFADRCRKRGLQVAVLPHIRFGQRDVRATIVSLRVLGSLARRGFALVHANTLTAAKYCAAAVPRRLPLVGHLRDRPRPDRLTRILSRRVDHWIAISRFIEGLAAGVGLHPCRVVYNGVELPASPAKSNERAVGGELRIATVAHLVRWKQIDHAIEAAALLHQWRVRFHWSIIGRDVQPRYAGEVRRLIQRHHLEDHIEIDSSSSAVDYRDFALLVHPALEEPFGRVIIEALGNGLPVVAYASGAIPEIVGHGENGYLAHPMQPTSLARGVQQYASDRELLALHARRAPEAASCYSTVKTVAGVRQIYRDVLGEKCT